MGPHNFYPIRANWLSRSRVGGGARPPSSAQLQPVARRDVVRPFGSATSLRSGCRQTLAHGHPPPGLTIGNTTRLQEGLQQGCRRPTPATSLVCAERGRHWSGATGVCRHGPCRQVLRAGEASGRQRGQASDAWHRRTARVRGRTSATVPWGQPPSPAQCARQPTAVVRTRRYHHRLRRSNSGFLGHPVTADPGTREPEPPRFR